MKPLTFGSLFAGIGGFDLGLERAGMVCKWQVEIDPFCQKVLAKHWPDVRRYSDVRECGKHNLETVDVIVGGFPCQPHSLAGKQEGANDDRDLWPEYLRIIDETRPAWVVGENVPGIRTTILDKVLSDLEGLAYKAEPIIIPACAFNAPHRRARVFILAYTESIRKYGVGRNDKKTRTSHIRENESNGSVKNLAYADGQRCARPSAQPEQTGGQCIERANWWAVEPPVGRVANGVPNRVDRLRALGNAVVPQVAEWIGRQIVAAHKATQCP